MNTGKKSLWILVALIIVAALGAAAYYYFIIKKAPKPVVWDGSYKMTGTLTCKGNFPNIGSTMPMDMIILVVGNKVVDQSTSKTFDIDKEGKATEFIQQAANGADVSVKVDYQFRQENNIYKFTANGAMDFKLTKSGKTYSSTCNGVGNGVKQ